MKRHCSETQVQPADDGPLYPADHSFVVQVHRSGTVSDENPGRIEHLSSGRTIRFSDAAGLIEFVNGVLTNRR